MLELNLTGFHGKVVAERQSMKLVKVVGEIGTLYI